MSVFLVSDQVGPLLDTSEATWNTHESVANLFVWAQGQMGDGPRIGSQGWEACVHAPQSAPLAILT